MKGLFPNPLPLLKAYVSTWSESPSSISDMVEVCPLPQERFVQVLTVPTNRTLFGNGVFTDVLKIHLLKETLSNGALQKKIGKHRKEAGWPHREERMGAGALRSLKVKMGYFPGSPKTTLAPTWTLQSNLGTWVPPWTLQKKLCTSLNPPEKPGYLSGPSRAPWVPP